MPNATPHAATAGPPTNPVDIEHRGGRTLAQQALDAELEASRKQGINLIDKNANPKEWAAMEKELAGKAKRETDFKDHQGAKAVIADHRAHPGEIHHRDAAGTSTRLGGRKADLDRHGLDDVDRDINTAGNLRQREHEEANRRRQRGETGTAAKGETKEDAEAREANKANYLKRIEAANRRKETGSPDEGAAKDSEAKRIEITKGLAGVGGGTFLAELQKANEQMVGTFTWIVGRMQADREKTTKALNELRQQQANSR